MPTNRSLFSWYSKKTTLYILKINIAVRICGLVNYFVNLLIMLHFPVKPHLSSFQIPKLVLLLVSTTHSRIAELARHNISGRLCQYSQIDFYFLKYYQVY